jgi:branched-chain amino acid transport system ATP-binding protein
VLKVEGLSCRYGKVTAVSDLSLEVHKGELVTLIGANGAGKTTTLKAISGLIAPAGGRLIFEGQDITGFSARRILQLGVAHCPEGRRVFPYMTVTENLQMGCQEPSWNENMKVFSGLAINSENISQRYSHY